MAKEGRKCPKCGSGMGPGFLLDTNYGDGTGVQARWVSGAHERAFIGKTKLKGKDVRKVEADRCEKCGYLELFARERDQSW